MGVAVPESSADIYLSSFSVNISVLQEETVTLASGQQIFALKSESNRKESRFLNKQN